MTKETTRQFAQFAKDYDATMLKTKWAAPKSVITCALSAIEDRQKPIKILYIAAGTGELSALLKASFPNSDIHGVDASPEMLQIAVENHHLDAENIKIADLTQAYPYNDNEFDLVVCSGAAEYFGNPENVLMEMARITKPGGSVISTFRHSCLSNHVIHAIGELQNVMSIIPGISPIGKKTTTTAAQLSAAASQQNLDQINCTLPYTAYIQNLLHPLPIQVGPPIKYLTFSAQKPTLEHS